ncbi:hypothetical protein Pgy4_41749, partial [Pseudomonas savastanoi pv. glycinea str. race 4]
LGIILVAELRPIYKIAVNEVDEFMKRNRQFHMRP